jgi:hypothetical protein
MIAGGAASETSAHFRNSKNCGMRNAHLVGCAEATFIIDWYSLIVRK